MKVIKKVKSGFKYLFNKNYRFLVNCNLGLYNKLSDEEYLKRKFKVIFGYELNLENPKTFNEKLQWLKLYYHRSEYTLMADKYLVREYVANTIGEEYLIPLLGVWNSPEEIDFDKLPSQFVLKCNHNSGLGMCICKDKSQLNIKQIKRELAKGLKENYYLHNREWQYKDIPRKIVCEKYMEDSKTKQLLDYKFFVFNGDVKAVYIASDRQTVGEETKFDFFDEDFNFLEVKNGHPNSIIKPAKPVNFEKMKELASILGKDIPHVRVDFYEVDGKIYFGEMTFSHMSGLVPFEPESWDKIFGDWIILPRDN